MRCVCLGPALQSRLLFALWALVVGTLAGCGGSGGPPTAAVSGKVTHNGSPVTGGSLTFAPMASADEKVAGQPATGEIQPDGSYVLGTEKASDGAVIGQHRVLYSPPSTDWEAPAYDGKGPPPSPPKSPYDNLKPQPEQVQVEKGGNTIDIELVPR